MGPCYNRQGEPITFDEWGRHFNDVAYKRVARDELDDGSEVSTVWLGLDHSLGDEEPIIFETLIFGGEFDGWMWRYATEEEAIEGHESVVISLNANQKPCVGS